MWYDSAATGPSEIEFNRLPSQLVRDIPWHSFKRWYTLFYNETLRFNLTWAKIRIYILINLHIISKKSKLISPCVKRNKSKSAKFSNGHRMIAICNSYRFKYVLLFGITCCRLLTVLLSWSGRVKGQWLQQFSISVRGQDPKPWPTITQIWNEHQETRNCLWPLILNWSPQAEISTNKQNKQNKGVSA